MILLILIFLFMIRLATKQYSLLKQMATLIITKVLNKKNAMT